MWKFLALAAAALAALCSSKPTKLAVEPMWNDCGKHANRSLFLRHFNVTPHPVVLPGTVSVNMLSENTQIIKNMTLKLSIKRHIWMDYYLEIPCTNNYGSCMYENLCEYLDNPPKDAEEPMMKVKELFAKANHTLKCPLMPNVFEIKNVEHVLPELPPLVAMVAAGKYKIKAEIFDPEDNHELGCFELTVEANEKKDEEEEDDEYDDSCFFFC